MSKLKELLQLNGITQKQLSIEADVAEYRISNVCNGKLTNVNLNTAKKICKVLNCTLDEIFGSEENNQAPDSF